MAINYTMGQLDFDFEHVHKFPVSPPYFSYDNCKRQRLSSLDLDGSLMSSPDLPLPLPTPPYDSELEFTPAFILQSIERDQDLLPFTASSSVSEYSTPSVYNSAHDTVTGHYQQPYPAALDFELSTSAAWLAPTALPAEYPEQHMTSFPSYSDSYPFAGAPGQASTVGPYPVTRAPDQLASSGHVCSRSMRAESLVSTTSSHLSHTHFRGSRSGSPNNDEMSKWGHKNSRGSWSCSYPGCTSRSTFTRGCDLRKHYKRHTKTQFCRMDGCPQSTEGGFSSKKDRARHEAKHNPDIACEWDGCDRMFSRMDNMKDHVRRMHKHKA